MRALEFINEDFDRAARELAAVVVAQRLTRASQQARNGALIDQLRNPASG